ncbi:hypothetical protein [Oceanobacillus sp. FSL W7-1309]|uniref:hypothetical protein n=1 Tax=Oceanobacillus sp. FSL W7-1309 TaxID=2954539 RepID=UPI0030F94272
MNDLELFNNHCPLCKKRKATKLCDFIVRYDNSIIFFRDRNLFNKVNSPGYKHETCDLPMCEECAEKIGHQVDFCPHHYKLHLQVGLSKELQQYQRKAKAEMYENAISEERNQ